MAIGGVVKTLFDISVPASTYADDRKKGHGVVRSVIGAGLDFAAWKIAPEIMTGIMVAGITKDIGQAAAGVSKDVGQNMSKAYGNSLGFYSTYNDSQNAYTMRQRGLQAIQRNGLNARNVLGSEARMYHRNNPYNG